MKIMCEFCQISESEIYMCCLLGGKRYTYPVLWMTESLNFKAKDFLAHPWCYNYMFNMFTIRMSNSIPVYIAGLFRVSLLNEGVQKIWGNVIVL